MVQRPGTVPGRTPEITRPSGRPEGGRPGISRPDQRPSLERPVNTRPSTLPGMVTYPSRPANARPGAGDRPVTGGRPGLGDLPPGMSRPSGAVRPAPGFAKPNIDRRNLGLNRPATLPPNPGRWDQRKWGGNQGVWGNNANVNINNHFRYNNNFAYRPNYWGARPWWGAATWHPWHHGHWSYGWNSAYYRRHWWCDDNDFARGFMWGIGVWSLGNLIYQTGYQTYRNPYPAPPVPYPAGGSSTTIIYEQPVSVTAAELPPGDDEAAKLAETKSKEALDRSRAAFKRGDYLAASKAVDEALGYTPGDVSLHEYRALVFFALGKYSDAAGVLNSVLASGPGWGWDTMTGFYDGTATYDAQLRKLEAYAKGSPEKADARFLLGYHYMVCGHMEKAHEQFAKASELQPADSISRQLRDLTADSIPDADGQDAQPPARPDPVPAGKLTGTWICDRGKDGKVTFTMSDNGDYTWNYMNGSQSTELKGTYGLDDKGLLVLSSDDSQMVSEIALKDDKFLHFTLIGAPDGDPGLDFVKQ